MHIQSLRSKKCVYTHIIQTMETLVGQKKLTYGRVLNSARHSLTNFGVVGIADSYGVEGETESTITSL